jgi:hypothetical protein
MAVDYSWDTPVRELWERASTDPTDTPDYQKLLALANLKIADRMARYTHLLTWFTAGLLASAILQLVAVFWLRH